MIRVTPDQPVQKAELAQEAPLAFLVPLATPEQQDSPAELVELAPLAQPVILAIRVLLAPPDRQALRELVSLARPALQGRQVLLVLLERA